MALIDSEGLGMSTNYQDYLTYGVFNVFSSPAGGASINTGGFLGDNYLLANRNATMCRTVLPAVTSFFAGARINVNNAVTGAALYFDDVNGNNQVSVKVSGVGVVTVLRNGTVLGSSAANVAPTNAWFYLEAGVVIGTSGSVNVRVNNVSVLQLTNINTQNTAGGVAMWAFGCTDSNSSVLGMHFYMCDNTGPAPWNNFLGDVRVQTLLPVSNDAVAFAPNSLAANWQNVSVIPPVPGTDYNSDANVGDQDTFNCSPMSSTLTTVYGVNVKVLALKSDAGARQLEVVLKSGSTTVNGPSVALGTSAIQYHTMYQTDPNTSAQWTQSAVDAAKPGYKVSA